MKGLLLDTNILSELTRKKPEPRVVSFVAHVTDAWLSVITLHELHFGLSLLPEGERRSELTVALTGLLEGYREQILLVDPAVSEQAADLRATAHKKGRVLHLADALIAGTCLTRDLQLATRNEQDFLGLAVPIVNPWKFDIGLK